MPPYTPKCIPFDSEIRAHSVQVITAICFTIFGIEMTALGDRLGVCLTMLLTAVAFRIVLGDSLPKVSPREL